MVHKLPTHIYEKWILQHLGRSGAQSLHKQTQSTASSAAQMSEVNNDCYVHYYIQQQNASIA